MTGLSDAVDLVCFVGYRTSGEERLSFADGSVVNRFDALAATIVTEARATLQGEEV